MNSDSNNHAATATDNAAATAAQRGSFKSKLGIVLATAGSAVGLGNIWRFPVETGENGGAAFIILYLACVVLLGVPMMVAEFIIGRRTHTDIASAYERLTRDNPITYRTSFAAAFKPLNRIWPLTGYVGMLCVTLILSYYSVVAGWILKYSVDAAAGSLTHIADTSAYFADFSTSTVQPLLYTLAFLLITHLVIVRGVQNGIERFSKLLMPLLLVLMLVLVGGCLSLPGAADGLLFLLRPDFSKITPGVVLSAMGQAFFSLSIAIGCLSTYASYFKPDVPLVKTAANVVGLDTLVAIISGFIIFPAVFSVQGVQPDAGPGLVFVTLPDIFARLFAPSPVVGYVFSLMFYLLLVLAALTSTISMHEEVTAFFCDRYGASRRRAASFMTLTAMALASLCVLSFGPLAHFKPFFGRGFFDAFDDLTAQWLMPLSGIMLSLFVGWRLPRRLVEEELTNHGTLRLPSFVVPSFFFLIRWMAPIVITLIFVSQIS